jgi:hypothetical protein
MKISRLLAHDTRVAVAHRGFSSAPLALHYSKHGSPLDVIGLRSDPEFTNVLDPVHVLVQTLAAPINPGFDKMAFSCDSVTMAQSLTLWLLPL